MKVLSAVAVTLGLLAGTDASEHVERRLILGGTTVKKGTQTYMSGIRETPGGESFCGAVLVSPKHVLTTATCTVWGASNYVAVGTHYIKGTQDGERIKVVKAQNHSAYDFDSGTYDFALLTLEKASKFPPVKLPQANDKDISAGVWASVLGWGETSYPNGTVSNELRKVSLEVWDDQQRCAQRYQVDKTMVCAGGEANKDSCSRDAGSPLVKELKQGDANDVLLGLSSWGKGCGTDGMPSVYARVSSAVNWIKSITKTQ